MQKGTITLTEGRSGSSWLGELCNSTGLLGVSSEWVDAKHLGLSPRSVSGEEYLDAVVKMGSTENGYFALKLFPRHVHWFQISFGFDLIDHLRQMHDVQLIVIERQDRIKQAVSFARALQSKSWSSTQEKQRTESYDFDLICRCYFTVERSYAFWENYLNVRRIEHSIFSYENLVGDPMEYVRMVADHAGVTDLPKLASRYDIQRDRKSDDWKARFLDDAKTRPILAATTPSRAPRRSLSNIARFLMGRPTKPFPYAF